MEEMIITSNIRITMPPLYINFFSGSCLQEWRLVLVEKEVVYTSWIWIGRIWIRHTNHIAGRPTSEEQIWLWHWRLGHLSLSHLHKLFPSLFSMVQVSNFQYDSCVSQTSSNFVFFKIKKKLQCLSQLFINVWGPSCVINYLSLKWFLSFIDDWTHVSRIYLLKEKSYVFSSS